MPNPQNPWHAHVYYDRVTWGADLLTDPYYSPHLTYDREDFSLRLR